MSQPRAPVVAIIDSNDDIINALRELFESEGFLVATAHVRQIRSGRVDFGTFLSRYDPDVIVYDIAPPYEENWTFFKLLRTTDAGKERRYVVTTTNKAALERLVGDTGAAELIGKPFDLEQIVDQVMGTLRRVDDTARGGLELDEQ